MKLRNVFSTKVGRFKRDIARNDVKDMRLLMRKESDWIQFELFENETFDKMTPEMMLLFVEEMNGSVLSRWGMKRDAVNTVRALFLVSAFSIGRTDLADVVMAAKTDFNRNAANAHPAAYLLDLASSATLTPEKRMAYLRAVLAPGTDKVEDADHFIWTAARNGYIEGLQLLSDIGFDLNKDNEKALRLAARAGHGTACRYLAGLPRTDLDRALSIVEALDGEPETALFLRNLREDLPAEEARPPATVETLASEVADLKRIVHALSAVIEEMRGPGRDMDKKPLSAPPRPDIRKRP